MLDPGHLPKAVHNMVTGRSSLLVYNGSFYLALYEDVKMKLKLKHSPRKE